MVEPAEISLPAPHTPEQRWRRLRRLLFCMAIAYLAWCATLYFYQDQLVFPADLAPAAPRQPPPGSELLVVRLVPPEGVAAEGGAGQVEAIFWPRERAGFAAPPGPAPVIIFCHGNAEIADFQDFIVSRYRAIGCAVLVPEYRGYGRSAGNPSEAAIVADMEVFYDLLLRRPDVDKSRIVIHGRSLGGGIAAQLAARHRPAALILESTFTSIAAFAVGYGAPPFLATSPFRTDRVISGFDFPMLIFHGSQDSIIPVGHGRKLHALARGSRYVEYTADHNGFPGEANTQAYWGEVEQFLRAAGILVRDVPLTTSRE